MIHQDGYRLRSTRLIGRAVAILVAAGALAIVIMGAGPSTEADEAQAHRFACDGGQPTDIAVSNVRRASAVLH